VAEVGLSSKLL